MHLPKVSYTLDSLVKTEALSLQGTDATTQINFGMRLDQSVSNAKLILHYTLSPGLLPQLSHLKVFLNDELITTLPATKENVGIPQKAEIALDPMYFIDYNQLRIQLIGHYTDQCEFPSHSSLWAQLSGQSRIEFDPHPLQLQDSLALLPGPFVDMRDKSDVSLPVVLAASPSVEVLKAAGIVASWLGVVADYRAVRFPVSTTGLPKQGHAVVLATADTMPAGLNLPVPTAPMLSVVSNPNDAAGKLLVISGKNAADLQTAALALALGQAALSGRSVSVDKLTLPARRAAYDAPAWVDVSKPVHLGKLVANPSKLQRQGNYLGLIEAALHLPPDLYVIDNQTVPVQLKFRYTAPAEGLGANLSLTMNDQFVDALPLQTGREPTGIRRLLPARLLDDGTVEDSGKMLIPTFLLNGVNDLRWRFNLPLIDGGKCTTIQRAGMLAAIDPDSTIDLTGMYHYAVMPNLALYANSGFPFTKYADLAETAIVLPNVPQPMDVEAMLVALARMGAATGLPATRFEVALARDVGKIRDRDLLVISHGDGGDALGDWKRDLPMTLGEVRRSFTALNRLRDAAFDWWSESERKVPSIDNRGLAILNGSGPLGAMIGFRSPVEASRSVVALAANNTQGLEGVLAVLNAPGKVRSIQGDLALVRGDALESFRIESEYHVGELPWWRWLWVQARRHPMLMSVAGLLAGVLLAVAAFGILRRVADRRLGKQHA